MKASLTALASLALLGEAAPSSISPSCPTYSSLKEKNLAGTRNFLDAVMYPNNIAQAKAINSTMFTGDVVGRVDITNNFIGRELNTEYVFGLFATIMTDSSKFNQLPAPTSYKIVSFFSSGSMVFSTVLTNFTFPAWSLNVTLPALAAWTILFDECNRVQQYDLTFPRHDWLDDTTTGLAKRLVANLKGVPVTSVKESQVHAAIDELVINSVCQVAEESCTGVNRQYTDTDHCKSFLKSIPRGKPYQYGQNTLACRSLHQNMVAARPNVHCSHIGPSGGDMCIKRDYRAVTLDQPYPIPFIESSEYFELIQ